MCWHYIKSRANIKWTMEKIWAAGACQRPDIYGIVYRVLSIYKVLPGFREFAVFEKRKRFFYIFGWVLHRGGQGPSLSIYISIYIYPITLNGYINSPGKKSKKLKKIEK